MPTISNSLSYGGRHNGIFKDSLIQRSLVLKGTAAISKVEAEEVEASKVSVDGVPITGSSAVLETPDLKLSTRSGDIAASGNTTYAVSGGQVYHHVSNQISFGLFLKQDLITESNIPTAITSAISTAISELINGAPTALDTLGEIATALNNDAGLAATLTNSLGNKVETSTLTSNYSTTAQTNGLISTALDNYSGGANVTLSCNGVVVDNVVRFDGESQAFNTPGLGNVYLYGLAVKDAGASVYRSLFCLDVYLDGSSKWLSQYMDEKLSIPSGTPSTNQVIAYNGSSWVFANPVVAIADISDWPAGVSAAEVAYLDGVTASIQSQLDSKQASGSYLTAVPSEYVTQTEGDARYVQLGAQATDFALMSNNYDSGVNFGGTGNTMGGIPTENSAWREFPSWRVSSAVNSNTAVFSVSATGVTVLVAGYYRVTNQMCYQSTTQRATVATMIAKNDVREGPVTCSSYIRAQSSHHNASASLSHIVSCSANDHISVYTTKTAASGTVNVGYSWSQLRVETI